MEENKEVNILTQQEISILNSFAEEKILQYLYYKSTVKDFGTKAIAYIIQALEDKVDNEKHNVAIMQSFLSNILVNKRLDLKAFKEEKDSLKIFVERFGVMENKQEIINEIDNL